MEKKDNPEYVQVHCILGISAKRSEEIADEVLSTLSETKRVDIALNMLMKRYDAESLLVGIRLEYLLTLNKQLSHADIKTIERQNISLN